MKSAIRFVILLFLTTALSGCAGTGGYLKDRGRDAADIFTATVGLGGGAKARVGPVHAGLFANEDQVGLRGGKAQKFCPCVELEMMDIDVTLISVENFSLKNDNRNKEHSAIGAVGLSGALIDPDFVGPGRDLRHSLPYYTQIEVAAGLGPTIRLGFNPGELVDFLLGWFTIDIFADDIGNDDAKRTPEEKDECARN